MTKQLVPINNEFENLRKSIFSSISNVVPIRSLLNHSYNFTKGTNLTSPIEFTYWFPYNFLKNAKISFKVGKKKALWTINIQLYTHATVSKIYVKSILHNNVPFISRTSAKYIIDNQIGINYFSNFDENCFYTNNKTFCKKLTKENDCDNQYIDKTSNTFHKKCFDKQPLQNIATKIKNEIYFLIIEPILIDINCKNSSQTINIFESSKLMNNNCSINSSIFDFDQNPIKDYGIIFAKTAKKAHFEYDTDVMIQFYCLLAFLLLYILFIKMILYYYYKLNVLRNSTSNLDSLV